MELISRYSSELLSAISLLLIAIGTIRQGKRIDELQKKIDKLEAAENLNEIERQLNQLK